MKKLILSIFVITLSCLTASVFAQENFKRNKVENKDIEFRLKTNPLSPVVAYEPNLNLSFEKFTKGDKFDNGLQISAAYAYDWQLLEKNELNPQTKINGVILTGEFRLYTKGFYFGPYTQFKTIKATDYKAIINGQTKIQDISKTAYSGGFFMGYQFDVTKKISSEIQGNFGLSNKQLYTNGTPAKRWDDASTTSFSVIDQSGKFPQFIFTYKLIYKL
jgi:hypothetical protein